MHRWRYSPTVTLCVALAALLALTGVLRHNFYSPAPALPPTADQSSPLLTGHQQQQHQAPENNLTATPARPWSSLAAASAAPSQAPQWQPPQPHRSDLWQRQCGNITLQHLRRVVEVSAADAAADILAAPSFFHFHDGRATDEAATYAVGDGFCSVVFVPQTASSALPDVQNPRPAGWGPDAMHASIKSDDVWLIFQHPLFLGNFTVHSPRHAILAVYATAYTLNHPGVYQAQGAVEFQNYDWVMQGDGVDMYTMNQQALLPYEVLNITAVPYSKPLLVQGMPASRPKAVCYSDGQNDLHGRWYRASAFGPWGSQSLLNGDAELDFAAHSSLVDEWGWTFAPDLCTLPYFDVADYHACLGDRTMVFHADSNSRRLLKALMAAGNDAYWCGDSEDRLCQCQDTWERTIKDSYGREINNTRYFSEGQIYEPISFGNNSKAYFDMQGGFIRPNFDHEWYRWFSRSGFAYDSITDRRLLASGGSIDLVHLSYIGWDVGYAADPWTGWSDPEHGLAALRKAISEAYPAGTRVIHRLANAPCCGNYRKRLRYNIPRYAIWNEVWRQYFAEDEREGRIRVHDVSVLEGRPDAEMYQGGCPMTHLRASHVRLEAMMWMAAVCSKDGRSSPASMKDDWGL